jgi:predicted nucleic-acid-binding protein
MIAVDTNVIVRLLTRDDPSQAAYAASLFETHQIWLAKTVILETCWVLGSSYRYSDEAVRGALTKLIGLPNVRVEDETSVAAALALAAKGIDFADALHLSSRPQGVRFASFDQSFVRRAQKAGVAEAEILHSRKF